MKPGDGQQLGVESLEAFFGRVPRFAVAFSGGCDSAYLLAAAVAAGCQVKAYMVSTAFQFGFERADAERVVRACGADFEIIEGDVLAESAVCENPPDRCYWCKRFMFGAIRERMLQDGYDVLADGTNASDDPDRRPGFRALAEGGVVSPLRRAGMAKNQVREASANLERSLGLPEGALMSCKPSFSCKAVAVPSGEAITMETLLRYG